MKRHAQQIGRDALTLAGAGTCDERQQDALHEHEAGGVVGRDACGEGWFGRIGLRKPAGLGARHEVVAAARPVRRRPVVAPSAGRSVDEARVVRRELFVAEAEFLHHAGAEIVHDHIGGGDQRPDRRDALRGFQVEGEAAFVAVESGVGEAHTVDKGPPAAAPVAGVGALDLDHIGPVVGENLGADRPLVNVTEVDDADAGEGRGGGHGEG